MAFVIKDRVQETTTSVGTGSIILAGSAGAYQSFSAIGDGNSTYYAIAGQVSTEWEVGIGTYTAAGNTLSRDTILASSNSNAIVNFSAGIKDVFSTYPAERAVYVDLNGDVSPSTFSSISADTLTLGAGTITTTPVGSFDIANKAYVDSIAEGLKAKPAARAATTGNLSASYNNGSSGVGATLTATSNGAFPVIDGVTINSTTPGQNGVLVKNQTNPAENGRYNLTTVGDAGTPWVLTRCSLCDSATEIPGSYIFIQDGNTYADTGWVLTVANPATFVVGTDAILAVQFSGAGAYTAGTGLTLSGTEFSITNTAVTPGTYGSASSTVTATVNAQGQITSLTDSAISLEASQVTSGIISAIRGGTGLASYAVGDIIYADTLTSLAKLSDVATGNVLLSGGVNIPPSWGKVGLTTHIEGTLSVANGGTGVTTSTGTGNVVLSTSPTLVTPALGTPTSGTLSNCTGYAAGNLSGILAVANGGTGQTTANSALNALLPSQSGNTGKYLTTNGVDTAWATIVSSQWITSGSDIYYNTGNVGIGVAPTAYRLTVNGSSQYKDDFYTVSRFTVNTGSNQTLQIGSDGEGGYHLLWGLGNYALVFATNNTERARISSTGGFSVGTTADPGAGAIYATGNITAYYSSDARLKENIKDVEGALDKVCAIGSKTFDWTDDYIASKGGEDGYFVQKSDFGVVAQDVQTVFPQAVRTREDGTLAVDYEKLATLAFGAIKELVKRVEALEGR